MSIIVRKMQQTDSSVWAEMRYKLWDRLSLDEHAGDIQNMLGNDKRFGYIALLPDLQPIGFAEVCIREYANGCTDQPVPFLEGIWIDPKYRRQGAGNTLITKITRDLVADGFREICSDAEIRNRRSHQAHKNWGFHETSRVVYFRRQLADPPSV